MRYEISSQLGQIRPRAAFVLENLGNVALYHGNHGVRHPLGIYNLTLSELLDKITSLLDLLERANDQLPYLDPDAKGWDHELLDATDHVLDAVVQHLDAYKSIICCFFEDCASKPAQKILRSLNRDIREYRDAVATIVNAIKHKQRRLTTFFFHEPGTFALGYFVEGVLADGAIGPDPQIHRGSNVAISYNRDLPFHICGIYFCAAALANHIHNICGIMPTPNSGDSKSNDQLGQILRRVSALPMLFFPDEIKKSVPVVRYVPDRRTDGFRVTLEMPSYRFKPRTVSPGCHARATWMGNGVSRTFKMPYFGQDNHNPSLQGTL